MYCRICGDENSVKYYSSKLQVLCKYCASDTPPKVARAAFEKIYWEGCEPGNPPKSTRREFYSDYLASRHSSVREYLAATSEY